MRKLEEESRLTAFIDTKGMSDEEATGIRDKWLKQQHDLTSEVRALYKKPAKPKTKEESGE